MKTRYYLSTVLAASALFIFAAPVHALTRADLVNQSEPVGAGWYYSDWFGYFEIVGSPGAATGQIYHNEHGDLWVASTSDQGWWMACMNGLIGSFYIQAQSYPNLYRHDTQSWGAYKKGSAPQRWFVYYDTLQWYTVPAVLRHRPDGPHGPLPFWWVHNGLIDLSRRVSNHSPVNVGQLKHIATTAKAYLDARLDMRPELWDFAYADYGGNPFPLPVGDTEANHAIANLGQLKYLASGFYYILNNTVGFSVVTDHLIPMGVSSTYWSGTGMNFPWLISTPSGDNHKAANIGQLKLIFAFALGEGAEIYVDLDGNGLGDVWELQYFNQIGNSQHSDFDGDGASLLDEFLAGTNPLKKDHPDVGLLLFDQ